MKEIKPILVITLTLTFLSLLPLNSSQAGHGGPTVYYQGAYHYGYNPDVVVVEKHCHKCRHCYCDSCYYRCCRPCPPPRVYYRPYPRYYPHHPGVYAPAGGWYLNFGFGGRL